MTRRKKIIISIIVMLGIITFLTTLLVPPKAHFSFKVNNISIREIQPNELDLLKNCGQIVHCTLSEDVASKVLEDSQGYRILTFEYVIDNANNSTTLKDVRFNPIFDDIIDRVIVYTDLGRPSVTYLMMEPDTTETINQTILVDIHGISEIELLHTLEAGKISVSYFTGNMSYEDGTKYVGIGKKIVVFSYS